MTFKSFRPTHYIAKGWGNYTAADPSSQCDLNFRYPLDLIRFSTFSHKISDRD